MFVDADRLPQRRGGGGRCLYQFVANIVGFTSSYMIGWLHNLTGSYDSGLLAIAAVCNVTAFATLSVHHDKEMEQAPILDETVPLPGNVAEIV